MNLNNILISLAIIILSSTVVHSQNDNPENPALGKEIRAMRDMDQKLRNKWVGLIKKNKKGTKKYDELTDLLIATDAKNTERMKAIVQQYGWPSRSLVGGGPSNSAWLIVQHADRDPLFQIACLPLLKAAVDAGDANPSNYAYLYDRVASAKGEKQLYATQSSSNHGLVEGAFYPIEDESKVQERRASMGIDQPVEEYAKSMGFKYAVPTADEALERNKKLIESYNSNLEKAISAEQDNNLESALAFYKKATEAYGVTQAEDFYNYARLLAIQKPEESGLAPYALIKAALNGYDNPTSWKSDPIFSKSRASSPRNSKMLMDTINQLKKQ